MSTPLSAAFEVDDVKLLAVALEQSELFGLHHRLVHHGGEVLELHQLLQAVWLNRKHHF